MNKIQYIELLSLRGINELGKGTSIADAVRQSGGNPTKSEMVEVNKRAMLYFAKKFDEQKEINETLISENKKLQHDSNVLRALEAAGVDNWDGYDAAMEML